MKLPIVLTILVALAVVHSAPVPTTDSTDVQPLHHASNSAVQSHGSGYEQSDLKKREGGSETGSEDGSETSSEGGSETSSE
ncbi:hypothetical protein BG000_007961, partial [Podila horticola]